MTNYNPIVDARLVGTDREPIGVENGALTVALQDQHTEVFGRPFIKSLGGPYTLAVEPTIGSYTMELNAGHTFTGGEEFFYASNSRSMYGKVLSVSTNTLTLNVPITFQGGTIFKVSSAMNVDGSSTRQIFKVYIPASGTVTLDIRGMRFHITDQTDMDDAKFGGIAALTRGIVLRQIRADGMNFLHWNIKSNQEFATRINHCSYSSKAPSGYYGFFSEWRLDDIGVVIRIEPGDTLDLIIQDNLTGLDSFIAHAYGHLTQETTI